MKRLLIFLFSFGLAVVFSGCTVSKSFSPLAHEYLVSSLGFDQSNEEKTVIMEAVVINSEDAEEEKKKELLIGSGKTLDEALKSATQKAVQPVELSHCAVAVIGESVSEKYFDEILKYVYNEKAITIALGFVSTHNAEELLSCETVSSVAVGYDIVSMQQTYSRKNSTSFKTRFYEIEASRAAKENSFSLPFFKVDMAKYEIDGKKEFKNGPPKTIKKGMVEVVSK